MPDRISPGSRPARDRARLIERGLAVFAILCLLPALMVVRRAMSVPHNLQYLTARVERADLASTVQASGLLEGHHQVDVGAQVSGQVKKIYVRLGDVVTAGQLLADIDPVLSETALRIAESNDESLQAQRRASAAGLTQATLAYRRQKALLAQDATSQQELESARAQVEVIQANVASFDAQIRQARAQVESARASLAYTRIRAPMAGEVVAVVTPEGQTVVSSQQVPVILKLADRSTMTVKAQVSEADVIRIRAGLPAWFTVLGAASERFTGSLRAVEPVPGDSAAGRLNGPVFYNAVFDVPNPDGRLRIGMTAQVVILVARAERALCVPMAALGPPDAQGRYALRVVRPGNAIETLRVHVGVRDNVRVQVLDGLREGDQVVTDEAPAGAGRADSQAPA
ncbi:MAG: macrolide transporter subunit MacA [Pseudomonadota bacterium]|nr:macrolide transporter subunit MacA [Pseudomonadota bacterium]